MYKQRTSQRRILRGIMNTRADVIKILDKFFSQHKPLDIECEKPETSRLTNGVLKNLTYLDYLLEQTIEKDIKSIQKSLINILRCAIFEIVFDKTPEYAIVNSYVEISKKVSQIIRFCKCCFEKVSQKQR